MITSLDSALYLITIVRRRICMCTWETRDCFCLYRAKYRCVLEEIEGNQRLCIIVWREICVFVFLGKPEIMHIVVGRKIYDLFL